MTLTSIIFYNNNKGRVFNKKVGSSAVIQLETLKLNGILQFIVKERTKTPETEQVESQRNSPLTNCAYRKTKHI